MSERFKVEIYGQTYSMQGDLDPIYVAELASYVDDKMHSIADGTGLVDSVRVAVLASLAIADELHTLRKANQELRGDLRERAEKCLTVVERALRQNA
jgi:cell division protein ZapA